MSSAPPGRSLSRGSWKAARESTSGRAPCSRRAWRFTGRCRTRGASLMRSLNWRRCSLYPKVIRPRYPLCWRNVSDLPGDCETFLQQRGYRGLITLGYNEHLRQLRERMSDAPLVLHLPVNRQALLEQGARPDVLSLAAFQEPLDKERPGGALLIVHRPGECQGFSQQGACRCRVASYPGDVPE